MTCIFGIPEMAEYLPLHQYLTKNQTKLRFRNDDFAYAYVRKNGVIEKWALAMMNGQLTPMIRCAINRKAAA